MYILKPSITTDSTIKEQLKKLSDRVENILREADEIPVISVIPSDTSRTEIQNYVPTDTSLLHPLLSEKSNNLHVKSNPQFNTYSHNMLDSTMTNESVETLLRAPLNTSVNRGIYHTAQSPIFNNTSYGQATHVNGMLPTYNRHAGINMLPNYTAHIKVPNMSANLTQMPTTNSGINMPSNWSNNSTPISTPNTRINMPPMSTTNIGTHLSPNISTNLTPMSPSNTGINMPPISPTNIGTNLSPNMSTNIPPNLPTLLELTRSKSVLNFHGYQMLHSPILSNIPNVCNLPFQGVSLSTPIQYRSISTECRPMGNSLKRVNVDTQTITENVVISSENSLNNIESEYSINEDNLNLTSTPYIKENIYSHRSNDTEIKSVISFNPNNCREHHQPSGDIEYDLEKLIPTMYDDICLSMSQSGVENISEISPEMSIIGHYREETSSRSTESLQLSPTTISEPVKNSSIFNLSTQSFSDSGFPRRNTGSLIDVMSMLDMSRENEDFDKKSFDNSYSSNISSPIENDDLGNLASSSVTLPVENELNTHVMDIPYSTVGTQYSARFEYHSNDDKLHRKLSYTICRDLKKQMCNSFNVEDGSPKDSSQGQNSIDYSLLKYIEKLQQLNHENRLKISSLDYRSVNKTDQMIRQVTDQNNVLKELLYML